MRVSMDCRESRGGTGRLVSRVDRIRAVVVLICALAAVALYRIPSAAAADADVPPAAGNASPFKQAIDWLAGQVSTPAVVARHDPKSKARGAGTPGALSTEPNNPAELRKLAAESLYAPTAAPQKLTLEQLEAISKLGPKTNRDGIKVHPAMLPLFKSMVLRYTGGTYQDAPHPLPAAYAGTLQPGKKYPLVVWLHGAGECGSDNINQLSHLHHIIPYLVGPKKRDFFLLVPQCPHTHVSWEAPEICSTTIRPRRQRRVPRRQRSGRAGRCPAQLHAGHDRRGDETVSGRPEPRHASAASARAATARGGCSNGARTCSPRRRRW